MRLLCSWNPGCSDTLNSVAYYINLLQGSMGSELTKLIDNTPCGGSCEPEAAVCKQQRSPNPAAPHPDCGDWLWRGKPHPHGDSSWGWSGTLVVHDVTVGGVNVTATCPVDSGYSCTQPVCIDAAPYCHLSSPAGVRARQICPRTCGCHLPRSTLALLLPESGCPFRCRKITVYRDALAAMPCEDAALNDTAYNGFLDNWQLNANTWPKDWRESSSVFIDLFRRFGCDYLNMNALPDGYVMPASQPLFWPANFGVGVSPCVENGYYYPVKPMSYFCPVACGCRAGDNDCPDSCPARNDQRNSLGQVDYSSLEPNPSPRNVPEFPVRWRTAFDTFEPQPSASSHSHRALCRLLLSSMCCSGESRCSNRWQTFGRL